MRGQLVRILFRGLLVFGSQLSDADGKQRGVLFQHSNQPLGTIDLGVNRKHLVHLFPENRFTMKDTTLREGASRADVRE